MIDIIEVDKLQVSSEPQSIPQRKNDIAIIQYTSGTTSFPKGVTISFENLFSNLAAIKNHFGLNESSVCFSWLPHYHDMGLVDGLLSPLFNQCSGIITSPVTIVANPLIWLKAINKFKVTHTGGPNFIFDHCVEKIDSTKVTGLNLESLSHFYVSAEPVRKTTLEKFAAHFKGTGFGSSQFTPGYGLAEATLMVTCKEVGSVLNYLVMDDHDIQKTYVGLGRPIPGIQIKIIDPETRDEKEDGESGEIVLRGPTITRGYYNDELRNSYLHIEVDENGSSVSYLRTGDIGLLINGELFVTGRLKDTINIRGVQYYAEDLEYVISNCQPSFVKAGCAVFGIAMASGEGIVVIQEIKKGDWGTADYKGITDSIREVIFDTYGLIIHDIILLPQGSIPKTTSGKIKRSECRNQYLKGVFSKPLSTN